MRQQPGTRQRIIHRTATIASQELGGLRLRRSLLLALCKLLPELTCYRLRTVILRLAGIRIGSATVVGGSIIATGQGTLTVGTGCWINAACRFDLSADITIGDGVAIGQDVLILTNSHEIGDSSSRADRLANEPVEIGDGSWLGARAVILPGVTVGAGSIVAAGAVVVRDVEPDTLVGGVPASKIRNLEPTAGRELDRSA